MDGMFDFDPQLPELPLAFDLDAVARLFEERWPAPGASAGASISVRSCRLQDTKYQPAARCVTTYELGVERPGAGLQRTIGVVEITPAGGRHRLFDDDPQLPWLGGATDTLGMRGRFAQLWDGAAGAAQVQIAEITPVRYKPGARCVFRYQLRTPAGDQVYFGKLLAADGERLLATISALHQASQAIPELPRIPQPLAYWPEVCMLVQPAVAGGAELNAHAFDAGEDPGVRERWVRDAGARLAALHRLPWAAGPRRGLEDDLDELREYRAPMAQVSPDLAARYEQAITTIRDLSRGRVEPPAVASHGAFRTDQFMIEDGRLVMIDLDTFCHAPPARDVGNFLAYLAWKAIRQPQHAAFIERAGQAFLQGYERSCPTPAASWLALYRAASMLKIAGRRFRSLTFKEWPLVPRLLDEVVSVLGG